MTPWEDRQLIEAFDEEFEELVHFAAGSVVDCGFGYMDRNGVVDPSKPVELWITGRMTYVSRSRRLRVTTGRSPWSIMVFVA